MGKTLIDTNVVVDYLGRKLPLSGMRFINRELRKGIQVSIITKIELFSFNTVQEEEALIKSCIGGLEIIRLDDEIAERAVRVRKNHSIKVADAIIAATALTRNLILITRNIRDFKPIPDMHLINPWIFIGK
jgi:predicted nucleic acid-binding protein